MELCPNWSGDGRVCPCAVFDLDVTDPRFPGQVFAARLSDAWDDGPLDDAEDDEEVALPRPARRPARRRVIDVELPPVGDG